MIVLDIIEIYDKTTDSEGITKSFEVRALLLSDSREELEAVMRNYVFSESARLIVTIKEDE